MRPVLLPDLGWSDLYELAGEVPMSKKIFFALTSAILCVFAVAAADGTSAPDATKVRKRWIPQLPSGPWACRSRISPTGSRSAV